MSFARSRPYAASLCLITAFACAEQKSAAPDVPVPPSFVPRSLRLKPPPLPPGEIKVLPLDWKTCSGRDQTLIEFTGGNVVARCETEGSITRVQMTVAATSNLVAGGLRHAMMRFCGDVQGSESPAEWSTTISRPDYSPTAADVSWTRLDEEEQSTGATPNRLTGLAVTLRGNWSRGVKYYVADSAGSRVSASPHDCS